MCVDGVQRLVVGSLVELGLNKYGFFFFLAASVSVGFLLNFAHEWNLTLQLFRWMLVRIEILDTLREYYLDSLVSFLCRSMCSM